MLVGQPVRRTTANCQPEIIFITAASERANERERGGEREGGGKFDTLESARPFYGNS